MKQKEFLEEFQSDEFGIYCLQILFYTFCWLASFGACWELFGMTNLFDFFVAVVISSLGTFIGGILLAVFIWFFWKHRAKPTDKEFVDDYLNKYRGKERKYELDEKGKAKLKDDKIF